MKLRKRRILLLLLLAAATQCHSRHRNNHGRNHDHNHHPNDYHHRRHESQESHQNHNYHDFPDSFEDSSHDLEDNLNSGRTPRSDLEDLVVDLKPIENPVTGHIPNTNKSAIDTEAVKKAYDMDKGYNGIRIDEMSDAAEPNNLDGDTRHEISLNINDIPKSDGSISANGFLPTGDGNIGSNFGSNLGVNLGDHNLAGNPNVNLGGISGFPVVTRPGLHLGGNLGGPFGGSLGLNLGVKPHFPLGLNSFPDFRLGGNFGVRSGRNLGINLGGKLGFPSIGIKDFHSFPYLNLGGNNRASVGLPMSDNSGINLGSNVDLPYSDDRLENNSDNHLGSNLDVNVDGNNLGADSHSINSRSSLEDLIDYNSEPTEKNVIDVNSGKLDLNQNQRQSEDMDNLEQKSKIIDGKKYNTEDNIGSDGVVSDYNNKPNSTDTRGAFLESNETNNLVNKTDGESLNSNDNLNADKPGVNSHNDNESPQGDSSIETYIDLPSIAHTLKDGEKPEIDPQSLNKNKPLITPEHDNLPNKKSNSTEIPSIETSDKSNTKAEDGGNNQLEMIPVLMPGDGYVLLPASIVNNMPSYIVVMINGQPTLLQNPSIDVNGGSLDLSKFILVNGLSNSDVVLPSWYNRGQHAGGGGATIGILSKVQQTESPILVGDSDRLLTNPNGVSAPYADSVTRSLPTLPISVPGRIDPGFSPSFWNNLDHGLQNGVPNANWAYLIDPDINVYSNVPNPTSPLLNYPIHPYSQYLYPYSYPTEFNPFANNNKNSAKNVLVQDNNGSPHQNFHENSNAITSSDPRKHYPNISSGSNPETHLNMIEGRQPEINNYGLNSESRPDIDDMAKHYTRGDFHDLIQPNPDLPSGTELQDDSKAERYPVHEDDIKLNVPHSDNWDDKSIERRLKNRDDKKIEFNQEDKDDINITDGYLDGQHDKWIKYHPDHWDNKKIEHHPDRDDKWNKHLTNQRHEKRVEPHPDQWDDKSIESYPIHGVNKKINSHLDHSDEKLLSSNHREHKGIKPHLDHRDDKTIKTYPQLWDNGRIMPHPDHRNDKKVESHPYHWDDEKIEHNLPHRDDESFEANPGYFDDTDTEPYPDRRDDKSLETPPDHWNDKRIKSKPNYSDDKRIEAHSEEFDSERIQYHPDNWDDKKVGPHLHNWDDEGIKPYPYHRKDINTESYPESRHIKPDLHLNNYVPNILTTESDVQLDIPLINNPESQTNDPISTYAGKLPNILLHPEQNHDEPLEDIPGFHSTHPLPIHADNSDHTSLINDIIDSLNILLKYPHRVGHQSKEVKSLIKLLIAILNSGDKNQKLVSKQKDGMEEELDLENVKNLLLRLLKGHYQSDPKVLSDSSIDESTRTSLILLLKLLVNNQDLSSKGTENPLLYFLGQFPCDLSKKRQEASDAVTSKLLKLLVESYDRGDLQSNLERTAALSSL
ncbi:hypothetical protein HF086_014425 [Spodoptera exigua]|uniref:Uncharacterized protein n=1 Tax=Spodoptera exigua TaxID=7107 RepID=A0A922MQS9_SPOEX|nr:hypothetical protein HF086_014425 [Spodoptera exigua]